MEKNLTREELLHIAELSKLNLDESEKEKFLTDLQNMVRFSEKISSASIQSPKEETLRLFCLSDLREDTPAEPLEIEKILSTAPTHTDSYITVPTIIEE